MSIHSTTTESVQSSSHLNVHAVPQLSPYRKLTVVRSALHCCCGDENKEKDNELAIAISLHGGLSHCSEIVSVYKEKKKQNFLPSL